MAIRRKHFVTIVLMIAWLAACAGSKGKSLSPEIVSGIGSSLSASRRTPS